MVYSATDRLSTTALPRKGLGASGNRVANSPASGGGFRRPQVAKTPARAEQSRVLARIALKIGIELPAGVRDLVETEDRRDIMAMAMEARGDPRLTAWEEGFLISVAEAARISRPLTEKQRAVLAKIATKVGTPPPDPVEAEVEDDDETA